MIYWISYTIVTDVFKTRQPSFLSLLSLTCKTSTASTKTCCDAQCNQGGRNWADYRKAPENPPKLFLVVGKFQGVQPYITAGFFFLLTVQLCGFQLHSAHQGTPLYFRTPRSALIRRFLFCTLTSCTCSVLTNSWQNGRCHGIKNIQASLLICRRRCRLVSPNESFPNLSGEFGKLYNQGILGLKTPKNKTNKTHYLSDVLNCKVSQKAVNKTKREVLRVVCVL